MVSGGTLLFKAQELSILYFRLHIFEMARAKAVKKGAGDSPGKCSNAKLCCIVYDNEVELLT